MSNNKWDETTLNNLRIHELRDLARKIGVRSPTSRKKEDLINQSLQILKGEASPYVSSTKKGRPNRKEVKINDLVELLIPNDLNAGSHIEYQPYESVNFFANMPSCDYDSGEPEQVKGLVEILPSNVGVIRVDNYATSNKDVFIHESFIKRYGLKTGDEVVANAKLVVSDRPRSVTEIITVNKEMPNGQPLNHVVVGDREFKLGDIALFMGDYNALDMFESIDGGIRFYVSAYDKTSHVSTADKIYATVSPFKLYKDIYCCYNLAFNRAKILSSTNTVTIVINAFEAYYRALEAVYCDNIGSQVKLDKVVQEEILKMFEDLKKNNVTTIVYAGAELEPQIKNFLMYELKNIVDYCEVQ